MKKGIILGLGALILMVGGFFLVTIIVDKTKGIEHYEKIQELSNDLNEFTSVRYTLKDDNGKLDKDIAIDVSSNTKISSLDERTYLVNIPSMDVSGKIIIGDEFIKQDVDALISADGLFLKSYFDDQKKIGKITVKGNKYRVTMSDYYHKMIVTNGIDGLNKLIEDTKENKNIKESFKEIIINAYETQIEMLKERKNAYLDVLIDVQNDAIISHTINSSFETKDGKVEKHQVTMKLVNFNEDEVVKKYIIDKYEELIN